MRGHGPKGALWVKSGQKHLSGTDPHAGKDVERSGGVEHRAHHQPSVCLTELQLNDERLSVTQLVPVAQADALGPVGGAPRVEDGRRFVLINVRDHQLPCTGQTSVELIIQDDHDVSQASSQRLVRSIDQQHPRRTVSTRGLELVARVTGVQWHHYPAGSRNAEVQLGVSRSPISQNGHPLTAGYPELVEQPGNPHDPGLELAKGGFRTSGGVYQRNAITETGGRSPDG